MGEQGRRDVSMATHAYSELRAEILSNRLKASERINISEYCGKLGCSLGAVREALSRLVSEGLVEAERNKGFRVAPISQAELRDLTQTRIFIECECLKLAIRNGDLAWESSIVAAQFELSRLSLVDRSGPVILNPEWAAAHKRFHEALVAACDSAWLLRLRELLYAQSERYRSATIPLARMRRNLEAEHRAIADAALARDVVAAQGAMRDHLSLTTQILIESEAIQPPAAVAG